MPGFVPPPSCRTEHVMAPPFRFHDGQQLGTAHCAACGRGLGFVVNDPGACIVRPGFESPRFTDWHWPRRIRLGRA